VNLLTSVRRDLSYCSRTVVHAGVPGEMIPFERRLVDSRLGADAADR
jgi:hypothetical protein